MTTTRLIRASRVLVLSFFAAAVFWASAAPAYYAGGGKDAAKGNDCLIGYEGIDDDDVTLEGKKENKPVVRCTDCDPACDKDGVDTANGTCTFKLSACLNEPGVVGCTAPAGLTKAKASAKVQGVKGKIDIEVPQLLEGSVCGALLDIDVDVKETNQGAKEGKGTVGLSASLKKDKDAGIDKKRSDKDKITVICEPRPEGEACPEPQPPCGNGSIDDGEECDPNADPTGCSGTLTCVPGGEQACTCQDCVVPSGSDPTSLTFTTGPGTSNCGSVGFTPNQPAAPHSGSVADGSGTEISPLGLGCLYIGGGDSTVPGGVTPNDAPNTYSIDLICNAGDTLQLGGSTGTSNLDCSRAAGPAKNCANGHPGTDGNGLCTSDADCRPLCSSGQCVNGAPGLNGSGSCTGASNCGIGAEGTPGFEGLVCLPAANCFFGPPLPVRNGALSTCVDNVFIQDASGNAVVSTGEINLNIPLSSRVHLTGNGAAPCPQCLGGTCALGERAGLACTAVGIDATTHDCEPNEYSFLAPLGVTLGPLTTGTATLPADGNPSADGVFCANQNPAAGAFGSNATRLITEIGVPVSGGLDTTAKDTTLGSTFCIPQTGNLLIDGAADLPGPGATSLGGVAQLQ